MLKVIERCEQQN